MPDHQITGSFLYLLSSCEQWIDSCAWSKDPENAWLDESTIQATCEITAHLLDSTHLKPLWACGEATHACTPKMTYSRQTVNMLWLIKCPMMFKNMMHFLITGLLNWDFENRSYNFNHFLNWWLYKKWLSPAWYQGQPKKQSCQEVDQHNQRASQDMLWYSVLLTSSSLPLHLHLSTYCKALSFGVRILSIFLPITSAASTCACFKLLRQAECMANLQN